MFGNVLTRTPPERGSSSSSPLSRCGATAVAVLFGILIPTAAVRPAAAADNPYQRGPDPTQASVAASRGTFATAETSVGGGNGFGAAKIYYPTDTSQGTFGALAVAPGYTATWAAEGAWMGHWLASFGFVISAALRRPTLKAAIGNAPFSASQNLNNMRVPTALLAGQRDGTVTPSTVSGYYNQIPASTEKLYLELTGAGHGFPTSNNSVMTRKVIPWMKIFLDLDTRYQQFLCPIMDNTGISASRGSCPLLPGGPTPGTTFSLSGLDQPVVRNHVTEGTSP